MSKSILGMTLMGATMLGKANANGGAGATVLVETLDAMVNAFNGQAAITNGDYVYACADGPEDTDMDGTTDTLTLRPPTLGYQLNSGTDFCNTGCGTCDSGTGKYFSIGTSIQSCGPVLQSFTNSESDPYTNINIHDASGGVYAIYIQPQQEGNPIGPQALGTPGSQLWFFVQGLLGSDTEMCNSPGSVTFTAAGGGSPSPAPGGGSPSPSPGSAGCQTVPTIDPATECTSVATQYSAASCSALLWSWHDSCHQLWLIADCNSCNPALTPPTLSLIHI